MVWFSARLLHVILVDDKRPRRRNDYDETVVIFRARDRAHAFKRALALGLRAEHEYLSVRGKRARWAFVEVSTIDQLSRGLDAREISSRLHARSSPKPLSFNHKFNPAHSRPGESGVV